MHYGVSVPAVGAPDDHEAAEYAAVGTGWLIESAWPDGDWLADLRQLALELSPS